MISGSSPQQGQDGPLAVLAIMANGQRKTHPPCTGPECDRDGILSHPITGKPICRAHYQQFGRHPERPLRPLRYKRLTGEAFTCPRCRRGNKPHFARGFCKSCYTWYQRRRKRNRAAGIVEKPLPKAPAPRVGPQGVEPAPPAAELERKLAAWETACRTLEDRTDTLTAFWSNLTVSWTHHSTAIEGNRLSYRETAQLLLWGETPGDHRVRDLDEVRGHAEAIATVRRWVDQRRLPAPDDLRGLHREVMFRPHWKAGPDGHRHWIETGEYKQSPNHVRRLDGTNRRFAATERVPELMARFCRDFAARLDGLRDHTGTRDVAATLAQVHQDFILIHPFIDGNGRMVRLVVNHMAMLLGHPPLIIKVEEQFAYCEAIQEADAGDHGALRDLFARALGRSLDFGLAVADGRAEPGWLNELGDPERKPERTAACRD